MPTTSERNQFRKLIGDFGKNQVNDAAVDGYLDDAVTELTMDFVNIEGISEPVTDFGDLSPQYRPEVITYAAINWWWNVASMLVNHHSQNVGNSSHQASEKWDRAIQMIQQLEERYDQIQALGTDITMGNLSRFSKQSLMRYGGRREEESLDG